MKKKKTHGLIPSTSANPLQHVLRAHLQVMLWTADESNDITNLGWVIQDTIPIPGVAQGAPVPPELLDVIKCQCKAQGKQCSTEACSCHKQHLVCTSYCNCSGMTVAIHTLWYKVLKLKKHGRAFDAEDGDYEEDAAIKDVVEEEPVEFADSDWNNFDDRCLVFFMSCVFHYNLKR